VSGERFRESTARDRRTGMLVVAGFLLGVTATSGLVFLLEPPDGLLAWLGIVVVSTVLLAWWNSSHSGYRCLHCGHEFSISTLTELISPHGSGNGGWKYLRCPRCDRKSRAKMLVREA
jgi:DNA-directed RNA polymerase subunit RPC12/RpoP